MRAGESLPFVARIIFRVIALTYPPRIRRRYGSEMEAAFSEWLTDRRPSPAGGAVRFWVRVLLDSIRNIPGAWLDWLRTRDRGRSRSGLPLDLKYTWRGLTRRPVYAAVVITTFALGIGTATLIFSVAHTVVFNPFPFPEADRIVTLWETKQTDPAVKGHVSPPTFVDWRESLRSFAGIAAYAPADFTLNDDRGAERVSGMLVAPGFFSLLGVVPRYGRFFQEDDTAARDNDVAVVSNGFWRERMGSDPAAIGRRISVDGKRYEIVGVLGASFRFPREADLWLPLRFAPSQLTEGMRGARYLNVIGRLQPGSDIDQAGVELTGIARRLGEVHPNNRDWSAALIPFHEWVVRDFRSTMLVLLGAVGFLLLVACANIVNLVLARLSSTEREIAMSAALGASSSRIFRRFLLENLLLASTGGAAGVVLAEWVLAPLVKLAPREIPRIEDVALDPVVLLFAAGLTIATGLLVSLMPLLRAYRINLAGSMRLHGTTLTGGNHRFRQALVIFEVAVAIVLLTGATLLFKSFERLNRVDPGFDTGNITTAWISLPQSYGSEEQRRTFFDEFLARLNSLDVVQSAALTTNLPLSGSQMRFGFSISGRPDLEGENLSVQFHVVSPGYFRTLGIRIVRGREFLVADRRGSVPVVMINEAMANRYWPGIDPVGRFVTVVSQSGPVKREIVGVVSDVIHAGLEDAPEPEVYVPLAQEPWSFGVLVIRSEADPALIVSAMRMQLAAVDRNIALGTVRSMREVTAVWLAPLRFRAVLVGVFAVLALVLASVGVYGVISYMVTLRRNEMGVRMALGASERAVLTGVLRNGVGLALIGATIGIVAALALSGVIRSFLFDVAATDPTTYVGIVLFMLAVALLASLFPARRAARIDPLESLRVE